LLQSVISRLAFFCALALLLLAVPIFCLTAKEQRFEGALATLDGVHFADRDDYSVKFLEARVLAWAGQHRQAEKEFKDMRARFPQDLDIMVSCGYLRFHQREYL